MQSDTQYHDGELAVQRLAGESEIARQNSAIIANTISKGAWEFLAQQRLVVLASQDSGGRFWASILLGSHAFMSTPDGKSVVLDLTQTTRNIHDPFWKNIQANPHLGMLVIDFETRRRLRINGNVTSATTTRMDVDVSAAYPNCPKYIQRRHSERNNTERGSPRLVNRGTKLDAPTRDMIVRSDTFFAASGYEHRFDASHRGGSPGFVKIIDDQRLRIPDYVGNGMFNTLGNISVNPTAGLVFHDFERGRTLQMSGVAEVLWTQKDELGETGGTDRYWDFTVERWIFSDSVMPLKWERLDDSPYNPQPRRGRS